MTADDTRERGFGVAVRRWYDANARDLPWRRPDATAWGVLVSEVMLQQTPVARVVPIWLQWMRQWPTPDALAAVSSGEAVRAWGRLGYPRRALRLHAAATAIVALHGGRVPGSVADLRALPGIGDYTAAAVASFAFGERVPVLDTNVRRVYARVFAGMADATGGITVAERAAADQMLPPTGAASHSVAVMELGALVCTSRSPSCDACPVSERCAWLAGGQPAALVPRKVQGYGGTDREVRGRLMARLRESHDPVPIAELDIVWSDERQRRRALESLLADGLVQAVSGARYQLPA